MENEGKEVLTAKGGETAAPSTAPKKRNWIVIGALVAVGLCLALCVCAAVGGGVAYRLARGRSRIAVRPSIELPIPRGLQPDCGSQPDCRPQPDRGLRPDRDLAPEWEFGSLGAGALVVEVVEGGPADRAGLSEGTVILAVDGSALRPEQDLGALIAGHKPGDEVTLKVIQIDAPSGGPGRGQMHIEAHEVTVELGEHPDDAGSAYLGLTYVPFPGAGFDGSGMHPFMFEFFGDLDDDLDDDDGGGRHHFEFQWPPRGMGDRELAPDFDDVM